jgi:hypothetical protein
MEAHQPPTLWQDIVAATENLSTTATAMRIPLYVMLQEQRAPFFKRMKDIIAAPLPFFQLSKTRVPDVTKNGALFCFAHPSSANLNNLLPVAREALRRGLLSGIVVNQSCLSAVNEFVGQVPCISIQELVAQLSPRMRIRNVARVHNESRLLFGALCKRRPDLTSSLTANWGTFMRSMVVSVQYDSALEDLFDRWEPHGVVSTSDFWPLEHHLCCIASNRRISSFVIQHGTIGDFWWPFVADIYCVWGDADAEEMKRLGVPEERLAVLGMPATDEIFKFAKVAKRSTVTPGNKASCLILSNTHGRIFEPAVFEAYGRFLMETVSSMPSVRWRVKLHPAEDDSFYRQLGSLVLGRLEFYPKKTSLQEAVTDADVVTTIYSTAGLEAMIMDRPLIVAPLTSRVRELAPWPIDGGGVYISSAKDFSAHFSDLISSQDYWYTHMEKQRTFLDCHFANRGSAAARTVDFLEEHSDQLTDSSAHCLPNKRAAADKSA